MNAETALRQAMPERVHVPQSALHDLAGRIGHLEEVALIEALVREFGVTGVAVTSSFGAESAVLLDLVAQVDPAVPVIFLDTGHHFPETLDYARTLTDRLGLTDVRWVRPSPVHLGNVDPKADLWSRDPDYCCTLRKVLPLDDALAPFTAWITGRKRVQGASRADLPVLEWADGRIKANPLADWDWQRMDAHLRQRDLPRHPLVAKGFTSIGCGPCTACAADPTDRRSGRWAGRGKTECGIHLARG